MKYCFLPPLPQQTSLHVRQNFPPAYAVPTPPPVDGLSRAPPPLASSLSCSRHCARPSCTSLSPTPSPPLPFRPVLLFFLSLIFKRRNTRPCPQCPHHLHQQLLHIVYINYLFLPPSPPQPPLDVRQNLPPVYTIPPPVDDRRSFPRPPQHHPTSLGFVPLLLPPSCSPQSSPRNNTASRPRRHRLPPTSTRISLPPMPFWPPATTAALSPAPQHNPTSLSLVTPLLPPSCSTQRPVTLSHSLSSHLSYFHPAPPS